MPASKRPYNESDYKKAAEEYNCVTPEWQFKWGPIESDRGHPDYNPADVFMQYAKDHNMKVRAHTLIWDESLPDWVANLTTVELEKEMVKYIT